MLVNRTDVWGAYWPLDRRDRGSSWTAPAKRKRGRALLTQDVLARHFCGRDVGHVVGLHSTSPDNMSRWGGIDLDAHDGGKADPAANLAAALAWYDRLVQLGFDPLLTDSNGKGGYHLLGPFAEAVPTARVFAFLKWLVRDHREHGLMAPPEIFPKQATIKPGGFGNWLRLPGRHHTRDHWSRAWDGRRWLDGMAAVELLLALTGAPPAVIPADVEMAAAPTAGVSPRPSVIPRHIRGDALARRITSYVGRLPRLSAGQGRHLVGYAFACWLIRDLALADGDALPWLRRWDAVNAPPLGADVLAELLAYAHAYGRHGYVSGLVCVGDRQRGRRRHRTKTIRFIVEV